VYYYLADTVTADCISPLSIALPIFYGVGLRYRNSLRVHLLITGLMLKSSVTVSFTLCICKLKLFGRGPNYRGHGMASAYPLTSGSYAAGVHRSEISPGNVATISL
jgi:hypothetical protein